MTADDLLGRLARLATRRGWTYAATHGGRGSHVKVRLNGRRTVISVHRGDLPKGTFGKIKKDLGLTDDDLREV